MGRPRDAVRASRTRSRGGGVVRARVRVALFLLLAAVAPLAVAPLEVDPSRMTPEERRAVLERAFPGVFSDARAGDGAEDADGGAKAGAGGVPSIPRGRLGAVGEPRERDRAFERWVREPPSAPYVDDDETSDDDDDRAPFVGSVVLRSVFGRGRGLVTSARVEKGETLMSLPLLKCMSTASARRSRLAPALAELAANATEMTIDAVLALHLLHELHVQGEKSHWWPYVSALPKDVGSPLLWAPKELAQLEGSNLVGFRDAVLRGWIAERDTLFPKLTNAFPETFPEQHFRAANWAWAMSIVWSRAAHVPVAGRTLRRDKKTTILALVPLFDMINHGYARGAGSGSRPALNDAPAVSISFVESRGEVVVSAGDAFGGPGEEIRFNYGEKPSQYVFLQYGFVPRFNPDECVEVAPRMSKKDPLRRRKREVLASHDLSPNNRNFHFYPNRLDRDLLAATRVQVMTEAELDDPLAVASAVAGGVVSERNEAVTRATLLKAAHELLLRYPTTLAEDLATMDKFLDENPYDPVFGAEKRRTGDAPAIPREGKTRTRIRRDETSDAADSRYRAAVAMRVLEKRTLLSAARLLVQELDDALAEETCRERYARTREETRDCLARASGEAFDAFDARESAEEENGGGVRSEDGPGNERREASAGSARGGEL